MIIGQFRSAVFTPIPSSGRGRYSLPRKPNISFVAAGERMYVWRAVDHGGEVLDILVQRRLDGRAPLRFIRKLLKKQGFAPEIARHRQAALLRLRVPASATDLPA